MIKHNILNIESAFKGEQSRGVITSVATGFISNVLVYFGTNVLGLSVETSAVVLGTIIGNIISYIADVMFAKQHFIINGESVVLPITAYMTRLKWLLYSLLSKSFLRYWIIVFIDIIMTATIVGYLVKYFDKHHLFNYHLRNSVIVFGFTIASFLIYINPLRFTWAYNEKEDQTMNMLMLMWFSIALLIFVSIKQQTMQLQQDANITPTTEPHVT